MPLDPTQLPDDFELPASLRSDLASLYNNRPPIPAGREQAILASIHPHMARVRRFRPILRWSGVAAAIAAMVLLTLQLLPSRPPTFHEGPRVTILDAFSLARQFKANAHPDKSWDVNHDGAIDQKDVDALAARAVSLTPAKGVSQ